MLLLYVLWHDWPIFMISSSNEHLQQQLEYTVQSARENTLEERYAIKFCFKLEKNATETYAMLQTAFQASCMNRAWGFEWHKRFKQGRESVRDYERCGRSKEVRTPESICQIKNFKDKNRCVSIKTISAQFDVSVGTVHITRVPSGSMLALPDSRRPDRENSTTNFWWSLFLQHLHDLHALGSHWTDSQQGILCWGSKRVQEEIPSEEASTPQIGSVAFPAGQCTSLQLYPCHRLFYQDGHQDSCSAFLTLLPVTFGYSLSLQAVVMRQLRRWKRLWRRWLTRSHKKTSMGPSGSCWNGRTSALQPEEITSKGTKVSCVYYQ